jgi:hypothetical protein
MAHVAIEEGVPGMVGVTPGRVSRLPILGESA